MRVLHVLLTGNYDITFPQGNVEIQKALDNQTIVRKSDGNFRTVASFDTDNIVGWWFKEEKEAKSDPR